MKKRPKRKNGCALRVSFIALILSALSPEQLLRKARADIFGSGANSFEIEFVRIENPNNPPDTTGDPNPAGSVPYEYRIGKYEVPEDAVRKANAITAAAGQPLALTLDLRAPNKPATSLSWFEAAMFVNWLNTSSGSAPAYKFEASGNFQLWQPGDAGYNPNNRFRNTQARYFLPSADEWYKAAYYDPSIADYWDYPTGSNDPPLSVPFGTAPGTAVWNRPFEDGPANVNLAGGFSAYGSMGQGGNVGEWEEAELDLVNDSLMGSRGLRGGDWIPTISSVDLSSNFRNHFFPEANPINVGIRIASVVPEPRTLCLAMVGLLLVSLRIR
ncbi:MAG: SUMF1/EgtB/PvdO family nonheme iron enzyme [Pirellulales bacterium]